ncbi:MAG: outer membrane beta-barrel protein [Bacteroidetes bacterium]|nr:outer membrane beta-barrel protein [Bacteroidota bacterium]
MKKFILLGILIPSLLHVQAQRWHVNVFGGISNYSGDLQSKPFTMDQSYAAFGAGAQYDLTTHISLRSDISIMKIGAADKYNKPDLQPRNLSFETQIFEWNLLGEYTFIDLTRKHFSPYIFGGLALFHFNPYAFDSLGAKVYLQPLSTEGEGLPQYPNKKPYDLWQAAIPFGFGVKLRITDNVILAYEFGFRKTFTDYLDDVSDRYVDRTTLLNARGPKAVEMAYRGGELKGGDPTYPPDQTLRGGPKYKDFYYFTGIKLSVAIISKRNPYYGRGRIDCPPKM